ncbi:MAG: TPM domain-containing protein [Thermoguttaceae bacterium]|jgi:uncharacterized membrane protein YgcG
MKSSLFLCRIFLPGVLLAAFVGFAWAAGDRPAVRDDAGFFAPDTVRKANEDILALQKQFKVDLLIETVASVPSDKVNQVRGMNAGERDQFFSAWALNRARAAGIRGVYVLICKVPGHLQVEVGKETQKQAFTPENCNKLRDLLMARFKDKDYDKGLLAAIAMVGDTVQRNVPPTSTAVVARKVEDYAGFFSPTAVQKANADLQSLPREPGKDVAIETFPTPPPGRTQEVENMSATQRSKFFADWAEQRSRESNFDGILLLICKHPGHSQVDVRGSAARRLFTPAEISRLDGALLSRLRNQQYDQGLADTVRMLREKLAPAANVAAAPPAPVKAPGTTPSTAMKPATAPSVATGASVMTTPSMPIKAPDTMPKTGITSSADMSGKSVASNTAKTEPEKAQVKVEPTAHGANTTTAAKDDSALARAKEKVTEAAQTQFPTWMWVAGIVGGLLVLWIFVGILRALFGGGRHGPSAEVTSQRPIPPPNAGVPPQTPGTSYVRPPQGGGYPTAPQGSNYPTSPQGGGYPMSTQGGYPVPPAPVQQRGGGGGGGFVSGVLGGMFGAAAGTWMYDSFRRTGSPSSFGGGSTPPVPPTPSYRPSASPPASTPSSATGGDGYNTGGDFDSSPAAGVAGAGGDFDSSAPAQANAGAGGDFDSPTPAQANAGAGGDFDSSVAADPAGSGGDFDSSAPTQAEAGSGGDFGSPSPALADTGTGGDFDPRDTQAFANDNAGGDFGSPLPAQAEASSDFNVPSGNEQASSGGDFGSVASVSGDVASNQSGGDFGDSAS